ncbi:hypothetical protein [Bradyrhizobium sp. 170]|uniref:hypothetical protein n=1 Tax=Bradyrhizobium sp. 170 TaxID=2782641 RepID=UPI001FFE437D|nr:hypothetical protein [Bradyrhizobium sp. 170]UPK03134.1 hypothetical protein IVB05_37260 [Bradyrhizobium sp. 170]
MDEQQQPDEIAEVVRKLSDALRGEPMANCIAAAATFQSFLVCAVSASKGDALKLQDELHQKITASISKNYDTYHAEWVKGLR